MSWVQLFHDIRIFQKNWEPVGLSEIFTKDPPTAELRIRIRRRPGAPYEPSPNEGASGPRVGGSRP